VYRFEPMPATPDVVGATWLPGEGPAGLTLRRRVAAIACACGVAELDTKHPAIRETLRGITTASAPLLQPWSSSPS
jgi:hypothetical protein